MSDHLEETNESSIMVHFYLIQLLRLIVSKKNKRGMCNTFPLNYIFRKLGQVVLLLSYDFCLK